MLLEIVTQKSFRYRKKTTTVIKTIRIMFWSNFYWLSLKTFFEKFPTEPY